MDVHTLVCSMSLIKNSGCELTKALQIGILFTFTYNKLQALNKYPLNFHQSFSIILISLTLSENVIETQKIMTSLLLYSTFNCFVVSYNLPIAELAATRTFPPPSMKSVIALTFSEPPNSSTDGEKRIRLSYRNSPYFTKARLLSSAVLNVSSNPLAVDKKYCKVRITIERSNEKFLNYCQLMNIIAGQQLEIKVQQSGTQ